MAPSHSGRGSVLCLAAVNYTKATAMYLPQIALSAICMVMATDHASGVCALYVPCAMQGACTKCIFQAILSTLQVCAGHCATRPDGSPRHHGILGESFNMQPQVVH